MISGNLSRCVAALLALLIVASAHAAGAAPKVAIVSFGLFGDQSVFESEANGAAKIVADCAGHPATMTTGESTTCLGLK